MPNPEDLKARLMAQLEGSIERLIAQQPLSDQITLSDMERLVKQGGSAIDAQMMQALIEAHETLEQPDRRLCPECQQPMRHKGKQRRKVVTEVGEIEVNRPYYYCEQCHVGLFPPG